MHCIGMLVSGLGFRTLSTPSQVELSYAVQSYNDRHGRRLSTVGGGCRLNTLPDIIRTGPSTV
jgi:hypothetical protein